MKEYRRYILYSLSILFFVLAAIQENQTLNNHPEAKLIKNFNKTLIAQEYKLSTYLNNAENRLKNQPETENYTSTFADFTSLFEDGPLGFLIFKNQNLVYWSDNQFAFPNIQNRVSDSNRLLTLPNGIYLTQKRIVGSYELIGLVHLKNDFSYENQFLKNTFVPPFKLPENFTIISDRVRFSFEIKDITNQYLFSVQYPVQKSFSEAQLYLPAILYFIGFLFLLIVIYHRIGQYREENFLVKMFILLVALFVIYWMHIILGIPTILTHFRLFSAQYYAISTWLPSLGDFFLITVLSFFWCFVFVKEFPSEEPLRKKYLWPAFTFVGLMYQLIGFMISNLIRNSNITYKLNRITDIDLHSVSGYVAIALLLFSVFLIQLKIIERTAYLNRKNRFLKINLLLLILSVAANFYFAADWTYLLTLFFAVNVLQCQIKKMHISQNSLSYSIIFISLFSVISLLVVYNTVKKRDIQVQKLLAITLGSEQDPVAEYYLARMQNQFNTDAVIPSLLVPPYEDLENYLTRTYFSGYFRKYDIQIITCAANDNVYVQADDVYEPCFPYFDKMVKNSGSKVPGSNFYYMNNMNGRVSYFGKLHYQIADIPNGISVFIEIDSKIISEGIGFPELLMDRSLVKPFRYKYLSYAKYFDDELVNRSGEYTYNNYLQSYNVKSSDTEFQLAKWDGYDHLIYRFDNKNCIIVSNRSVTFADYLISFPYIFVFYFLFVVFVTFSGNPAYRTLIIPKDLRFRIQFSIISIVLISLLFVATGTIYYNIQEYRNRHQVDLQEKIKSISEEIRNRMIYVNYINPELKEWLYSELYKLSNIFRTDINIYDVNGEMIATSRPEIFAKGLTSERINSKAYYELSERYQLNYFQPEKIGNLSYLSAYEPILNINGNYLGYLNLPYFTREDDLKQGISTFVVAFINLYLLLFLASVIIAVILSNRITQPLSLIREKIRGIQLGKKNEQINYEAEDEIGSLVQEYNHKVEELVESAELLARSERESAWREMAKQIAHEIKNPLTPMKLNIQYLQRAKSEGKEHYDDFFDRVTKNLIEQIDTLSGIATEFSNFAQIPKAKNEIFNLIEILQNLCSLFEANQNLSISADTGGEREILVHADKEQLSRALLNLVKNGIQSIPPDQKGVILLRVQKTGNTALVEIKDNGSGISPEAREHLFEPNFTTKTSGMGLGLSIVRDIITSFRGNIWYETTTNNGTSFFVELPLYETNPTTENNRS